MYVLLSGNVLIKKMIKHPSIFFGHLSSPGSLRGWSQSITGLKHRDRQALPGIEGTRGSEGTV